jgi:hypothetical protein
VDDLEVLTIRASATTNGFHVPGSASKGAFQIISFCSLLQDYRYD